MGNAVRLHLDRHSHLLLDLFCRVAGPLRDDLDPGIRDVWICFDGKCVERQTPPDEQKDSQGQDEHSLLERKINDVSDHLIFGLFLFHAAHELERVGHDLVSGSESRQDKLQAVGCRRTRQYFQAPVPVPAFRTENPVLVVKPQ